MNSAERIFLLVNAALFVVIGALSLYKAISFPQLDLTGVTLVVGAALLTFGLALVFLAFSLPRKGQVRRGEANERPTDDRRQAVARINRIDHWEQTGSTQRVMRTQ